MSDQCKAFTNSGSRCKRRGPSIENEYDGYCWQHHRAYNMSQYEDIRCKATTLNGTRCRRTGQTIVAKGYCWQHANNHIDEPDEPVYQPKQPKQSNINDTSRCMWGNCLNLSQDLKYCKAHTEKIYDAIKKKYKYYIDKTPVKWTEHKLSEFVRKYDFTVEDGSITTITLKKQKT